MKSVCDVLHGQTPNALYPFLWVHGVESEEELRREVQKIRESGIGGFCVEARPHKDFNGPGWFRDLALLLDEAKRTGMEMWILDDSHFPTGFADGAVKREHPELCKKFLCCKTLDYAGPMENMTAVLKYALRDPRDKILAVTLSRKTAFETIDPTTTIDLTDKVYTFEDARTGEIMLSSMGQPLPGNPKEGPCVAVDFDLPDGQWTLNVITVSYKGGEKQTEGYLNPLDSAATKVLLDTVYEPIYAHFGEEFGKTLCGFFSDEPRLGNIHGAEDAAIGHNSAMNLPWRDGMENLLAGKLAGTALTDRAAGNIRALLPLLFLHSSDESAHVAQYTYMDLVSQLYSDNFDGVLAAWCHAHHCEHIGHTIEDNNATARLGYGAGHFYRAMAHQDMSGIDVVIQQLLPGMDEGMFKGMHSPGWDGEFFTYMLGKLGASLAHLDPAKKGRAMCELFGAYGWGEGNRLCKWLSDYMLVRGINQFVPHAFNAAPFPDPDCPPHFYAHGHNPQYPEFRQVANYLNRMSAVLSGTHVAPVALLYQAEAEWSGEFMLTQKPAARLARNGIDYELVPCEVLKADTAKDGALHLNGMQFRALVIPYAEALPVALLENVQRYLDAGVKVYFVGGLPIRCCEGGPAPVLEHAVVTTLDALVETLTADSIPALHLSAAAPYLRYYHARQADGDVYFFTNEGTQPLCTTVTGAKPGAAFVYDAFANVVTAAPDAFALTLAPYESRCILVPDDPTALQVQAVAALPAGVPADCIHLTACTVSLADADTGCAEYGAPLPLEKLLSLHRLPGCIAFAGRARYAFRFTLNEAQAARPAVLALTAQEGAIVRVNGTDCGVRICPPYRYAISGSLHTGENLLEIEVNTTLGRRMNDFLGQYMPTEPQGLTSEVTIQLF